MNLPTPENQYTDWEALFTSLFLLMGIAFLLAMSGLLVLFGLSALPGAKTSEPLNILLLAAGTFFLVMLLIPGFYLNCLKFFNRPYEPKHLPALNDRIVLPVLITIWLFSLVLGNFLSSNQIASAILLPMTNIIAIGLPILFYIRISLRGLELPTARRGWSIFGASIMVTPTLAFIFEGLALGAVIVLFIVYASFVPGLRDLLKSLMTSFQSSNRSEDESMRLVAHLIFAPGVAVAALGTFSVAVPLIEETFKVILILPFLSRLRRPVDGFVLGILCGAAFALSENIGFSSAGSADWAANVAARATAALPHMFNSGLFGWALVSAWKQHRYGRLVITFISVLLVHGTWNAISLGLAMNNLAPYGANIPFYLQNSYPWIAAWIVLAAGSFAGLLFNNLQMRKILKSGQMES
jgi:hypothetical protein